MTFVINGERRLYGFLANNSPIHKQHLQALEILPSHSTSCRIATPFEYLHPRVDLLYRAGVRSNCNCISTSCSCAAHRRHAGSSSPSTSGKTAARTGKRRNYNLDQGPMRQCATVIITAFLSDIGVISTRHLGFTSWLLDGCGATAPIKEGSPLCRQLAGVARRANDQSIPCTAKRKSRPTLCVLAWNSFCVPDVAIYDYGLISWLRVPLQLWDVLRYKNRNPSSLRPS